MAMFPTLMNDTMFSDLFDDPFFEGWRNTNNAMSAAMPANMMTTDVRETDKGYDVDIDMPGFKKDDINLELNNGYLTCPRLAAASMKTRIRLLKVRTRMSSALARPIPASGCAANATWVRALVASMSAMT